MTLPSIRDVVLWCLRCKVTLDTAEPASISTDQTVYACAFTMDQLRNLAAGVVTPDVQAWFCEAVDILEGRRSVASRNR